MNSEKKIEIINATLIVIICKMLLSPQTPLFAYLAVFLQGLLGFVFYSLRRHLLAMCLLISLSVQFLNAFIKIFSLTLLFGFNLWIVINEFISYIISQFSFLKLELNYSYIIILIYIGIHGLWGIILGLFTSSFILNLSKDSYREKYFLQIDVINKKNSLSGKGKHKFMNVAVFLIFAVLILSYFIPYITNTDKNSIIIMLIRGILIMILWFKIISPLILKYLRRYFAKRKSENFKIAENILNNSKIYKSIIYSAWSYSASNRGLSRILYFVKITIINFLVYDIHKDSIP
jgi:hypothetical protein